MLCSKTRLATPSRWLGSGPGGDTSSVLDPILLQSLSVDRGITDTMMVHVALRVLSWVFLEASPSGCSVSHKKFMAEIYKYWNEIPKSIFGGSVFFNSRPPRSLGLSGNVFELQANARVGVNEFGRR